MAIQLTQQMNTLNRQKVLSYIKSLKHKIFNVTWIKQDGTTRTANVKRHVKVHNRKRPSSAHRFENSHVLVYILPQMTGNSFIYESGWRMINLETIQSISCKGKTYTVTPEPITEIIDLTTTNQKQPNNVIAISA